MLVLVTSHLTIAFTGFATIFLPQIHHPLIAFPPKIMGRMCPDGHLISSEETKTLMNFSTHPIMGSPRVSVMLHHPSKTTHHTKRVPKM